MKPENLAKIKEAIMDAAREGRLISGPTLRRDSDRRLTGCSLRQAAEALGGPIVGNRELAMEMPADVQGYIIFTNDNGLVRGDSQYDVAVKVCKLLDERCGNDS